MLIGEQDYPIEQSVLFLILIIVLGLDVFLFNRGHGSYTVKYELMKKYEFFRVNQMLTTLVNFLYLLFFILPFIIIGIITILRGTKNYMQFPAIFVNGLIIILIIYPIHREYYYFQYGVIWFLALASQLFSQFLTDSNLEQQSGFIEISFIFYTVNSLVFCLALLFNQKVYWELQEALKLVDQGDVQKVNASWLDQRKQRRLPQIFYGGIYGSMSKNQSFSYFLGIYLFSVAILSVYAIVIYAVENSILGLTGAITNIIYDIFILIFSSLRGTQRSIKQLFFMVYIGRLLSFVFGQQYWLFGYCILYFFVGIFIGNVIINKHFPLRIQSSKKQQKRLKMNVFKSPQFLMILLTLEIFGLILAEQLSDVANISTLSFNERSIPIWQFAILIVIAAWIIILFLLCGRLLARHIMKIREMVEYYFGFTSITEYHAYMFLTYLLILAAGLYSLLYLNDKNIFLGCIFLPIIYLFVSQIGTCWIKNDYCILAEHQVYDKTILEKLEKRQIKLNKRLQKLKNLRSKKKNQSVTSSQEGSAIDKGEQQGQMTNTEFQMTKKSLFHETGRNKNKLLAPLASKQLKNTRRSVFVQSDQKSLQPTQKIYTETINIGIRSKSDQQNDIQRELKILIEQRSNYKPLKNWRRDNTLTMVQIWQNFTPYDKSIIFFSLLTIIMFVIYSIISFLWAESVGGLGFSLSIISLLTTFVYYKINKSHRYNTGQIIIATVGFLIGVVFWSICYNITFGGVVWSVASILLYGICLQDGIQKNIQITFYPVLLSIKIGLLLFFICILLGLNLGISVLVVSFSIVIFILFASLNVYHLLKKGHIPKLLKIASSIMVGGIVVTLAILGFALNILSNFSVFAITIAIIIIALYIVYLITYYTKNKNELVHPHVYSAYGLTIYRFQSQIQQLKVSTSHVKIFNASMILLVTFCSVTTLFFKEKYMAIYGLSIFMIFQFTQLIFRSIQTYYFFGQHKDHISQKIVGQSFKKVAEKYMAAQIDGADSPEFIKAFEETKEKAQKAENQDEKKVLWLKASELKEQVLQNLQEQERFLFFWLALIKFGIYTERQNMMNSFLVVLEEIKKQLQDSGIVFESIESADPVQIKYKMVRKQLFSLPPDDYLLVNEKIQEQLKFKKKKQKELEELNRQEKKAHEEKMKKFYEARAKQLEERQKQMKLAIQLQKLEIQKSKNNKEPIDENDFKNMQRSKEKIKTQLIESIVPSQIQKFKKNIQNCGKQLYIDNEFKQLQEILGEQLKKFAAKLERPKGGQKFITGTGMSPDDVKQGKIGDCYLISSFAVLGEQILKRALGFNPQDDKKPFWVNQKGAYMVRFHIFSHQVYVIVDDYLPVDANGNRVFAISEDKLEFWPCILQKAYAKLYGGYKNIISGKCHQVLSQFTGGFPVQIVLAQYRNNLNSLWERIQSSKTNGYLMAAGSPSNQRGDSVASKRGIVQGHAYAILDVKQVDKNIRLIKLKNPHGSEGKQWSGDFSDTSRFMNKRMRDLLQHQDKKDGIFWMKIEDFIVEFNSLYICCIFQKEWKKFPQISDNWTNENSFGRPQKTNQAHRNYQLAITVTKKSTLFISLRQERVTALKGQNYILIRVQKNQGKRLAKGDVNSQNLCGMAPKLTNATTISQQILLENNEYPYTFTIYLCAEKPSPTNPDDVKPGQGHFYLKIFCNDLESTLMLNKEFENSN